MLQQLFTVGVIAHGPFHVTLTGAEPYFAKHDIIYYNGIIFSGNFHSIRATCLHCRKHYQETSVFAGFRLSLAVIQSNRNCLA